MIHTLIIYQIARLMGIERKEALVMALSIGSLRVFSSDPFNPPRYMSRTKRRITKRVNKRNLARITVSDRSGKVPKKGDE